MRFLESFALIRTGFLVVFDERELMRSMAKMIHRFGRQLLFITCDTSRENYANFISFLLHAADNERNQAPFSIQIIMNS